MPDETKALSEISPTEDLSGSAPTGSIVSPSAPTAPRTDTGRTSNSSPRLRSGQPTFETGAVVANRYRIVRFIAQGGMGEVYEAEDLELHNNVALKTVRPEIAAEGDAIARFKREISVSLKITHPNVCRIFDLGKHREPAENPSDAPLEVTFLTMELLPGETLSQRLRRVKKLTPEEALPIVRQVAAGLAAAHDAGIVHRDLKCSNVMLVPSPKGERAVVADFGLAHATVSQTGGLTGLGKILGTPAYMAPEQVEGKRVGPAADIYALGVMLFEMITGRWPFQGDTPLATASMRLFQPAPSPRTVVADIDPRWEAVILRCLERDPKRRFADADDVGKALAGEVGVTPPGRTRPLILAGAMAALLIATGVVVWWVTRHGQDGARRTRPAVAILGFRNLGAPETTWIATAASEMLRTELAVGEKLRAVPGESVTRMKAEIPLAEADSLARDTLARVRENVGADYVVVGSYLALGDTGRFRLDPRLQDTRAGDILASVAETGTQDQLFEIVARVGSQLRAALGLSPLSPDDLSAARAALPTNSEATRLYAEGLSKLRLFDALSARDLLQKAVEADPAHAPAHGALAAAWAALGYDGRAREEAQKAFDLSHKLPREERLVIEGILRETTGEWNKAVELYRGLFVFFPDNVDYGLRLATAQTRAGQAAAALRTIETLRQLPPPAAEDPRLDLGESAAAKAATDAKREREAARAAAAKAERLGARLLLGQALLGQGSSAIALGELDAARPPLERARELFAKVGDQASVAKADSLLGVVAANEGDFKAAAEQLARSLETYSRIGDQRGKGMQLSNLANVEVAAGNPSRALELYRKALATFREIGDRSNEAGAHNNIATILFERRQLAGSRKALAEALALYEELGETRHVGVTHFNIAELDEAVGQTQAARAGYANALEWLRKAEANADMADTLVRLGRLSLASGERARARKELEEALEIYGTEKQAEGEATASEALAAVLKADGDREGAERLRRRAAELKKTTAKE